MPGTPKVAIVGAGIGGLTAAIAMHRRGIEVEVYEQSGQIGEIGAGVSLSPNAIKAFRALGLDRQIAAIGFESDNQVVRAWNSGDVLSKVFRKGVYQKEFGAPYLSVHRADLVEVLRQQLPDHAIHLNARCTDVETAGNGARARFADGAEVDADLIVGADGIRSAVRQSLFGQDTAAIHRVGLLARTGAARCVSARPDQHRPHAVHGAAQPRHPLHGPARHADQFRRPRRDRCVDAGILDAGMRPFRSHGDVRGLARAVAAIAGIVGALLQMGALRPRSTRALEQRPRHAARRCGARDAAAYRPGRLHGDRGRLCARRFCVPASRTTWPRRCGSTNGCALPRTRRAVLEARARGREMHLTSRWAQIKRNVRMALQHRLGTRQDRSEPERVLRIRRRDRVPAGADPGSLRSPIRSQQAAVSSRVYPA